MPVYGSQLSVSDDLFVKRLHTREDAPWVLCTWCPSCEHCLTCMWPRLLQTNSSRARSPGCRAVPARGGVVTGLLAEMDISCYFFPPFSAPSYLSHCFCTAPSVGMGGPSGNHSTTSSGQLGDVKGKLTTSGAGFSVQYKLLVLPGTGTCGHLPTTRTEGAEGRL